MFTNKKGAGSEVMESDKMIFFVIIYMVLFLVGVFMVNSYFENVNVKTKCQTSNVHYQLLAARLINSASCLAWDQPVPGPNKAEAKFGSDWVLSGSADNQNYQARAGIVDLNKIQPGTIGLGTCMGANIPKQVGEPADRLVVNDFYVQAYDVNGHLVRQSYWGHGNNLKDPIVDTFMVKLWDGHQFSDGRVVIAMEMPGGSKCTG